MPVVEAGADPGGGDRPPLKPAKVTLFTMILYNLENNIRNIRPFRYPLFGHSTVSSPRGDTVGLDPQTKLQAPQTETRNTVNQWRFCQFLECQAAPAETQSPLLKTFWRRFCHSIVVKYASSLLQ